VPSSGGWSHDNRKKAVIECTCPKRLPKPKKKKPIKKTNPVYIEAMKLAIANSEKGTGCKFRESDCRFGSTDAWC